MPYALDGQGCPLFLISAMAMHTQNLQADPRASLLVIQPGWAGDPLAAGRVTLMGEAVPLGRGGGGRGGTGARGPPAPPPGEVTTAETCRGALIEMLRSARRSP